MTNARRKRGQVRSWALASCLCSTTLACGPPRPLHTVPTRELTTRPATLDLGAIRRGDGGSGRLRVANPGGVAVTIHRFEASCPCLTIEAGPLPLRIAPAGEVEARVVFDSRVEPEFRGRLVIGVEGRDAGGRVVLETTVKAAVE